MYWTKLRYLTVSIILFSLTFPIKFCAGDTPVDEPLHVYIPSPSLGTGWFANNDSQEIVIFLPDDYYNFENRFYPVCYVLTGYDFDIQLAEETFDTIYYRLDLAPEVITVLSSTKLNETESILYFNSEEYGNWGNFLVNDIIGYIDTNYRTIDNSSGRAVISHDFLYPLINYPEYFLVGYGYNMNVQNPSQTDPLYHEVYANRVEYFNLVESIQSEITETTDETTSRQIFQQAINQIRNDEYCNINEELAAQMLQLGLLISPNEDKKGIYQDFAYSKDAEGNHIEEPDIKQKWDIGLVDVDQIISDNVNIFKDRKIGVFYSTDNEQCLSSWQYGNEYFCSILDNNDVDYFLTTTACDQGCFGPHVNYRIVFSDDILPYCSTSLANMYEDGSSNSERNIPGYQVDILLITISGIVGLSVLKTKISLKKDKRKTD